MTSIIILLCCAAGVMGALLVIVASVMRCPTCGRWHESKDEEAACGYNHNKPEDDLC